MSFILFSETWLNLKQSFLGDFLFDIKIQTPIELCLKDLSEILKMTLIVYLH